MQTSPTPRASLLSLTGIRFIAAFIVVLFHINIALNTYDPLHDRSFDVLTHGYIGVSLFFVLSGFILTYTYIQPDRTLRGDRMTFWRARFARVYPVYVFALFVSGPLFAKRFLGAPLALESPQNVLGALFTPLLLQAWWPTTACQWNCAGWSLSVEALFYAVFPLLGVWLAKRSARTALIVAAVMWLGCLLFPVLYLAVSPDGTQAVTESSKTFWLMGLKYNPVVHLGEFAVGITCGLLFLRRSALEGNDTVPSWRMWGVLAIIIALVAGPWVPYPLLHSGVLAPLFALLIYWLARRDAAHIRTVLNSRWAVRLGECSYALYLLHPSVIAYFSIVARHMRIDGPAVYVVFAATLAVSLYLSTVVFDQIEEPARRWLRRREHAKLTRAAGTAGVL